MDDIQVIKILKANIRSMFPDVELYFYGSRVTRTHRDDSDYDVLVLLSDINPSVRDAIYDIAWETGFEHDAFISPVLASKDEFVGMSASPFFNNVKHYGISI